MSDEIGKANGHKVEGLGRLLNPLARRLKRPQQEAVSFDLEAALGAVFALRSEVPPSAFTASILGTEREGNGILIGPDGLVLTIGYLIAEATTIRLMTRGGRTIEAAGVGYDYETGFGLVRALEPVSARPLELGTASELAVGAEVIAAAHEERGGAVLQQLVAKREFAGYWEYLLDEALFTAPPHPGWGGAALLDARGRLAGVGSLFVQDSGGEAQPGNMFVPIDLLGPILQDLVRRGRPDRAARPWLGLYTTEAQNHLVVAGVAEGGPAAEAGMQPGDIVLLVDDRRVRSLGEFYREVWGRGPAGVAIKLTVARSGQPQEVIVRSADRYALLKTHRPH
jgi:S1-C subfamily serine protease